VRRVGLALALAGALSAAAAQSPPAQQHRFAGAEGWARVFDDPERDQWQKPLQVIEAMALAPDAVVADIGAGTGYFAVRLAAAVPAGRVYAVDLEPDMVRYVEQRARQLGLANVTGVQAATDDPRLPAVVDHVLLANAYHHLGNREDYFRRLAASLKPGGTVTIVDHRADSPVGPPARMRVPAATVKEEMRRAGYALVAEHEFLPRQHFLVFRRQQ
jgi:FkbM family methyltransferase